MPVRVGSRPSPAVSRCQLSNLALFVKNVVREEHPFCAVSHNISNPPGAISVAEASQGHEAAAPARARPPDAYLIAVLLCCSELVGAANMAEDIDVEAMLEAPYKKEVSALSC